MNKLERAFQLIEEERFTDSESPILAPPKKLMDVLGAALVGNWFCYHLTRLSSSDKKLVESRLEIKEDGACSMYHPILKVTYNGYLHFEGLTRFLIVMDAQETLKERIVYRFKNHIDHSVPTGGAWFGIDQEREVCGSSALLSNKKLRRGLALEKLNNLKHFWVTQKISSGSKSSVQVSEKWDTNEVVTAIQDCENGDIIRMMSTWFYDHTDLTEAICSIAKRRRKNHRKRGRSPNRTRVEVLLLDFRKIELFRARKVNRREPSLKMMLQQTREQMDDFLEIKKDFSDVLDVEIKLYKSIIPGKYVQVGKKLIFFAPILSSKSASSTSTFTISDQTLKMWNDLEQDFEKIFSSAVPADEVAKENSSDTIDIEVN